MVWVEDIFPNEPLVEEFGDWDWEVQKSAPEELRMLSMPKSTDKSLDYFPDYVFPPKLHQEVFIYHLELGINAQHLDFAGRRIEWLYTESTKAKGLDTEEPSHFTKNPGHSTCTASKAAGNLYGAAKFATLVVVKMRDLTPGSIAEVFSTVTDDVTSKKRYGRCVVTVSWGSKQPVQYPYNPKSHWDRIQDDLIELSKTEASMIFAAGNDAQEHDPGGGMRLEVDSLPASIVVNMRRTFVVSNCDLNGRRWKTSQSFDQGKLNPPVYAPGVGISCAAHDSNWKAVRKTGTSFSAPLAAGVLASTNGISWGRLDSWKRSGGENVVWNGAKYQNIPLTTPLTNGSWLGPYSNYTNLTLSRSNVLLGPLSNHTNFTF